ncbi:Transmembrane protein KIAA1109 [Geodia barretti]|uniref:Transmembrane protein KIAA1109 n=1 Tax=Geodia barretti TaxID=519541 RepID=A0AA35TZU3_GEOBA|nr:Transmembrane protein KIAA1109 [Geodia barretti]
MKRLRITGVHHNPLTPSLHCAGPDCDREVCSSDPVSETKPDSRRAGNDCEGSSLEFSKPRLVQISMTDVGACMPMSPVLYTPQTSQSFPALVLTVKEMLLVADLSRRVASSGSLSGFCLRFANQFTLRQRTWTTDLKKNKMINCGIVSPGNLQTVCGYKEATQ